MSTAKKEIDAYAQSLAKRVDDMFSLLERMPPDTPHGHVLRTEETDGTFEISPKQLQQKKKELLKEIRKDLPKFVKRTTKRVRKTDPEEFKGVYTPMVAADALRTFIRNTALGTVDPGNADAEPLLDRLPLLREGYGLRNSFQLLWYISIYANNLQDPEDKNKIIPDEAMRQAFEKIPSLYAYQKDEDTIKRVVNTTESSTFDMLEFKTQSTSEPFERSKFRMWVVSNILSLNLYDSDDLKSQSPDNYEYLKNPEVRQLLLKEFQLLSQIKPLWKDLNKERQS
jgi:hypothetical protein